MDEGERLSRLKRLNEIWSAQRELQSKRLSAEQKLLSGTAIIDMLQNALKTSPTSMLAEGAHAREKLNSLQDTMETTREELKEMDDAQTSLVKEEDRVESALVEAHLAGLLEKIDTANQREQLLSSRLVDQTGAENLGVKRQLLKVSAELRAM